MPKKDNFSLFCKIIFAFLYIFKNQKKFFFVIYENKVTENPQLLNLFQMHSSASSSSTDSDDSFQLADFVSFCLAMFRPLDRLPSDSCSEVQKRDFLLAELAFLRIFLYSLPQMLTSLAPLILQIIPEFFVRVIFWHVLTL